MEQVASTLHTTSEHSVSSITTTDVHTSAASSRLNQHSRQFKWTYPFHRKVKYGFCTCAITFQLAPNILVFCFWIGGTNMLIPECAHHTLYLLPQNIKTDRETTVQLHYYNKYMILSQKILCYLYSILNN
jgi:hypothetical protein